MPFYEEYQIINNHESFREYQTNENYREIINFVYRQTTPSLFSELGIKHSALQFQMMQNSHIFNTNEENDLIYMVGYNVNPTYKTFIISSIYVHPDYRRQGIASKLIKHIQDDICRDEAILIAAVDPSNKVAVELFYSLAFRSPLPLSEVDDLGYRYVEMLWSIRPHKAWHENRMLYAQFIE